jgi:hypothetical protein
VNGEIMSTFLSRQQPEIPNFKAFAT